MKIVRTLLKLPLAKLAMGASALALISGAALAKPAAKASGLGDQAAVEKAFDAQLDADEMTGWLKQMSSAPNNVGSPHDKANAEFMVAKFKSWGWDAHLEEFQVLYPTPIAESLELTGATPFRATLTEGPIPGDSTSDQVKDELPAYVEYQGDGDVTAPLVYVNYGMPEDYKLLERLGIDVKGKIVIARYGGGWRGLKPKLAQEHGAIGCIIYSDPHDDGYGQGDVYPKGGMRPDNSFQRGSVEDMTRYPGDPLTPGVGATKDAKRLTRETSPVILKIPALPISYSDAQHFLAALDGPVAPASFRGSLPLTYHVGGGGGATVHLMVKSDWSMKTVYDTVAMIKGSTYPDQWVLRGNHHDGWVFGAADPLSGNMAEMAEAKAIGGLVKQGWRPKRTLVYLGWDGEEPGLLGSTEWAETHEAELKKHGVLYLNTDNIDRGGFGAEGSHAWQHLVNSAAADVTDPETGVSLLDRQRAAVRVEAAEPGSNRRARGDLKAAETGGDMPMGALGSGSDYSSFLQHVGVASLNLGFGGEGESGGVYHSAYDSFDHHMRFDDPGLKYSKALAQVAGRVILRAADAPVQPERFGDFADTVAKYDDELHKLVTDMREKTDRENALIDNGSFKLASDPLKPMAPPQKESAVPDIKFAPIDASVTRLKSSAAAYDAAFAAKGAGLSPAAQAKLSSLLQSIDQTLLDDGGLPRRGWYRNMVYAPGELTGYGAKTLPAVREAIEGRRWEEANQYAVVTAKTLDAYAKRLDEATAIINAGK